MLQYFNNFIAIAVNHHQPFTIPQKKIPPKFGGIFFKNRNKTIR